MSAYREFTGKSVEDALREAREAFGVGLDGLDFEILTPGSRGVLGMGAEPARIVAAPRSELGGAAPKREAAASRPMPTPAPHEGGGFDRDRGPRRDDRGGPAGSRGFDRERGPRREGSFGDRDRPRPEERPAPSPARQPVEPAHETQPEPAREARPEAVNEGRPPRRDDRRGPRREDRDRNARPDGRRPTSDVSATEAAEVAAARGSLAAERADLEASEATPEALAAGQQILGELMRHLGFDVRVELETGDTSRLNVVGDGDEKEALGALIGRKGERLSALQHLVNLMLSKQIGTWTRVLVDVEDYRGRRERQLRELALRAASRVLETGKMLQLEPMPALERRWIHIALRDHADVSTQSIGEEPNRRIVVLPRNV